MHVICKGASCSVSSSSQFIIQLGVFSVKTSRTQYTMHQINLKEQSSPVKSRRECSSNFHLCPSNLNYDEASGRASSSRQVLHRAIKLNATSNSSPTLASFNGLFILTFIALSFIPVQVDSFMNLYLSRTETYRLLGE